MKRLAIIGVAVTSLVVLAFFLWVNKAPGKPGNPDAEISAAELAGSYLDDETFADGQFLGKTIQVTGRVKTIEEDGTPTMVLEGSGMTNIRVEFPENRIPASLPLPGTTVVVRGHCSGFLMDVILTNGEITND